MESTVKIGSEPAAYFLDEKEGIPLKSWRSHRITFRDAKNSLRKDEKIIA